MQTANALRIRDDGGNGSTIRRDASMSLMNSYRYVPARQTDLSALSRPDYLYTNYIQRMPACHSFRPTPPTCRHHNQQAARTGCDMPTTNVQIFFFIYKRWIPISKKTRRKKPVQLPAPEERTINLLFHFPLYHSAGCTFLQLGGDLQSGRSDRFEVQSVVSVLICSIR